MDTREDDHEEGELGPGARSVPAHLQRLAVDAALQVEAAAEKFSQRLPTSLSGEWRRHSPVSQLHVLPQALVRDPDGGRSTLGQGLHQRQHQVLHAGHEAPPANDHSFDDNSLTRTTTLAGNSPLLLQRVVAALWAEVQVLPEASSEHLQRSVLVGRHLKALDLPFPNNTNRVNISSELHKDQTSSERPNRNTDHATRFQIYIFFIPQFSFCCQMM